MKTLYLLRHAKSSWADRGLADHNRPLSPRGRKAALGVAGALARTRPRPGIVLCSPALRAHETWEPIAKALDPAPPVRVDERLYGAEASELLVLLRELSEDIAAVLVVAHNPGLQDLALTLSGEGTVEHLSRLREKFPTGALAILSTADRWTDLGSGRAYLDDLVLPREPRSGG